MRLERKKGPGSALIFGYVGVVDPVKGVHLRLSENCPPGKSIEEDARGLVARHITRRGGTPWARC